MELHQLRYFLALARERNFTRAAERCAVSQPSLSQQVRKLEGELGEPLVRRARRGTVLTPAGERLLPRARRILEETASIAEEMGPGEAGVRGTVRLGAIPTVAPYLLPELLGAALGPHPGLEVRLFEETTATLVDRLRDGELDFALVSAPFAGEEEMESLALCRDELLVALPAEHPLDTRARISLQALSGYPVVLMKEAHCLSGQSRALCESSSVRPRVSIESSQLDTVVSLVAAGLGFSFVPEMARPFFRDRGILLRPVAPKPVHRKIVLIRVAGDPFSSAESAFREAVRVHCADRKRCRPEAGGSG